MSLRFILGFIIGVAIGASLALALAPQPGAETRHQLLQKVKERAGAAREAA
jgi:gas vesicle protein